MFAITADSRILRLHGVHDYCQSNSYGHESIVNPKSPVYSSRIRLFSVWLQFTWWRMTMTVIPLFAPAAQSHEQATFQAISDDLIAQGFSIQLNAISHELGEQLLHHLLNMSKQKFSPAGIGRESAQQLNRFVRSDEICWINGDTPAGREWLEFASRLKDFLNQQLFLGLFSFETHFAHYGEGDFYKKHRDAFHGQANRVLSVVLYLNPGWQSQDGGELVIYDDEDQQLAKVLPSFATMAVFLSEEFPHEVLPAHRDRYSIAGWFRLNTTTGDKIDPPR
ncbi:2OG-Fe(II) oxygenase [Pleionea litopenaei]|uniref:2OG-Fe(II) oxygenase n=1 Tax=Pleionea litopenaei TaxID=3070815 RepID=A0AA51X6F6_9GAMM|nr:2OG-Fe(II) oxygenase [Pleionea sp. HL-JVS1]WMS86771.1 2OG-Fe(II) oxygenase [Pleionea sp. HL-JVS1]